MFSETQFLKNLTDSQTIYLARVELVKLNEMLENAYILGCSKFGGFFHARDPHVILYMHVK